MPITVSPALSKEERRQLAGILGVQTGQLDQVLGNVCQAALEEYLRMFLGQRVFTRGADMREYRLFLLIRFVFANRIPDEQKICDLFQTTVTQSRSLVRSVMSKYQYELSDAINATLKQAVKSAQAVDEDDEVLFTINSENVVEQMNRVLAMIDGTLPQVQKKKGTVSTYVLKNSAHQRLRQHFDLE